MPFRLLQSVATAAIPLLRKWEIHSFVASGSARSIRFKIIMRGFVPQMASMSGFRLEIGIRASTISHGQLENCDLTFKDLNIIESSFVTILAGHYHSRIEYPDQKDPDEKTLSEKSVENQVEKTNKTLSEKTLVKTEKKEDK